MRFDGKVVLVTGSSSGIGAETARRFAALGAQMVLFDKEPEGSERLAGEIEARGGAALVIRGDVSVSADCDGAVAQALARFGRIDVLVNNAGGGRLDPTETLSDENWRHTQAINADGTFYMSRAALRPMVEAGSGAIVNLSSIYGVVGFGQHIAYTAAKAAIACMTRSLAIEYGTRGIRVNCVAPGVIRTPLVEQGIDEETIARLVALHPIGRIGRVEEVAKAICFLASDDASFITGVCLPVDGGYTA